LVPEFDGKSSARISLESAFSCDYLLSIKDSECSPRQASSEENFAHSYLTESTLSLYYSESDSGHCELNFPNPSSADEAKSDHQTGICSVCNQSNVNNAIAETGLGNIDSNSQQVDVSAPSTNEHSSSYASGDATDNTNQTNE